ncbi:zinc finger protein [Pyrenophora seminiperda CCB06]|uniref:Zinc finger protein n=1 Tax=Pyrenophora seminiperda CCB06 TaxID=1302712 RepID=A0A3M7M425_9PLEO|nr:zinc finger protein [Pyrenophora seminiperda CCB06]
MAQSYDCSLCDRQFSTLWQFLQHCDNSPNHPRCPVCGFVGCTWKEFLEHYRETDHRTVCRGCIGHWAPESWGYDDHLEDENVCPTCEMHFNSPSNLAHHEMVHLEKSEECFGCSRTFSTYPAMILHVEAGTCTTGLNKLDLNRSAAMCFQWKAWLNEEYRDDLLDLRDTEEDYCEPVRPFKCPECDVEFTKLSGLFQHVYSQACQQGLFEGKVGRLVKWLHNRHWGVKVGCVKMEE